MCRDVVRVDAPMVHRIALRAQQARHHVLCRRLRSAPARDAHEIGGDAKLLVEAGRDRVRDGGAQRGIDHARATIARRGERMNGVR